MVTETNLILIVVLGSLVIFIFAMLIITFNSLYNQKLAKKDNEHKFTLKNKELELLKATIDTQEAEREKIALNLHDEVGPLLSSVKFKLAKYKRDFNAGKLTEDSFSDDSAFIDTIIQNVRGVSHDLSPQHVVKFGLAKAIETFTAGIDSVHCMVVSELDDEKMLSKTMSRNLYCIILELVNNSIKHDTPTWFEIEFFIEDDLIKIRINHDGEGLTTESFDTFEAGSTGLGLSSVKSRMVLLNGTLSFSKVNEMSNTEIVVPFA
ncbi:MAG: two-component system NarL family sensor kinase [Crocinitomicaceae bacterium]|jgi:two-component system NarL family sensor kinase